MCQLSSNLGASAFWNQACTGIALTFVCWYSEGHTLSHATVVKYFQEYCACIWSVFMFVCVHSVHACAHTWWHIKWGILNLLISLSFVRNVTLAAGMDCCSCSCWQNGKTNLHLRLKTNSVWWFNQAGFIFVFVYIYIFIYLFIYFCLRMMEVMSAETLF